MIGSYIIFLIICSVANSDDDVWVWGRDSDSPVSLRGRQADFLLSSESKAGDPSKAIRFHNENFRTLISKEIASPTQKPIFQHFPIASSAVTADQAPSKSRAIDFRSSEFQSIGNAQQIHNFAANHGFKPSESFKPLKPDQLSTIYAVTAQQKHNPEQQKINQNFSPAFNTLSLPLTRSSSKLQIIPAIQTASLSQSFGQNFPPFQENFNNILSKETDNFDLRSRNEQIFGKSEPAKRSAISTENPIRSVAFVVPADISILPLEQHEPLSSSSSSSQGRLFDSPVPSSFKREASSSLVVPTTNPPSPLTNILSISSNFNFTSEPNLASPSPFIPSPQLPSRKNILSPRFPPRENLLVKELSSESKIHSTHDLVNTNESFSDLLNSTSKMGGLENGNPRITRTINHESQKTHVKATINPKFHKSLNTIENHSHEMASKITVSSSEDHEHNDDHHSAYIIDIPNLETPKWPYSYLENEIVNGQINVGADAIDVSQGFASDHAKFSADNHSSIKVTKLSPLLIKTIRNTTPPISPFSSETFGIIGQRYPKSIEASLLDPNNSFSGSKEYVDNGLIRNNVVNQDVLVPANFYFPSETLQNHNIKTEQVFIHGNDASHGGQSYINSNLEFQPSPYDTFPSLDQLNYDQFAIQNSSPGVPGNVEIIHQEYSSPNFHSSNSVQHPEPSKDSLFGKNKDISSTFFKPLKVEIVKPNTLHTITDTVVDGKVTTTFYEPLKVTIYNHDLSILAKPYDVPNEKSKVLPEYENSHYSLHLNSQPSYSAPIEISNQNVGGLQSNDVNYSISEYDDAVSITSSEFPSPDSSTVGITKAFSLLEKSEQDNILSIMQRARGGYPASLWKWPE